MVVFYGNTGSGKSTAVNYFTKVPLVIEPRERDGDLIVRVDESKLTEQERESVSKIGHAFGISETIFSKGYSIRQKYLNF